MRFSPFLRAFSQHFELRTCIADAVVTLLPPRNHLSPLDPPEKSCDYRVSLIFPIRFHHLLNADSESGLETDSVTTWIDSRTVIVGNLNSNLAIKTELNNQPTFHLLALACGAKTIEQVRCAVCPAVLYARSHLLESVRKTARLWEERTS